jgi:hypothetical protein
MSCTGVERRYDSNKGISPEEWARSLLPSNVVYETAFPGIFELTNRVCYGELWAPGANYLLPLHKAVAVNNERE